MENQNTTMSLIQKIRYFALGFIGVGILSQGTLYFKPQTSYHVPRILIPIFESFGNVGLAIGMVLVGSLLFYYGFHQWRNAGGGGKTFLTFGTVAVVVFYGLFWLTDYTKRVNVTTSEEDRQKGITQMQSMERPDFGKPAIEKHFSEFDLLYKKLEASKAAKNGEAITECEAAYVAWTNRMPELYTGLSVEEMQQLALYCGKLSMQWQELSNR